MADDAKRIEALERGQRELVQRVSDLESQQRRQKSDIDRSVGDAMSAAIRHIEGVSAATSKKIETLTAIGESTLALNKTQSATLEDVKTALDDAKKIISEKAIAEAYEAKRAKEAKDAQDVAEKVAERENKRRLALVALITAVTAPIIYLVGAAYASQHHELPERPETHEGKEK